MPVNVYDSSDILIKNERQVLKPFYYIKHKYASQRAYQASQPFLFCLNCIK
jgi:hypothetical protein